MNETHALHAVEQISRDVYRMTLDGGAQPMRYRAGQFLSMELPDGSLRSYSMAQPCASQGRLELHIRLRPGGKMAEWLPTLSKGDAVRLHGPFGGCVWDKDAKAEKIIMLATGTGIAPLHAILQTMLAEPNGPPIALYWGARSLDEIYMLESLQQLASASFRFVFVPVLSRPERDWAGEYGHVQHVATQHHPDLRRARVYACGSSAMVNEARALLSNDCGLLAEHFFADSFEPADVVETKSTAPQITITATMPDGVCSELSVATGATLYRGLKLGQLIHGVCGGKLSCGTCRITPASDWTERLPAPTQAERRLLATLDGARAGERLACQITLTPALDGLAVSVVTNINKQKSRTQAAIEAVGQRYVPADMLALRELTFDTILAIAGQIRPGMVEEAALELAKATLAERGLLQGWHGVYVRFGRNTVKSWSEKSEPGVVLGEDDIFFIDIGPTWHGLEGDGALTFLTGDNAEMRRCEGDARTIFEEVRERWQTTGDNGQTLYDFAQAAAERRGWLLNLELSGHRLGDFPHALHFDGTMAEIDFKPSPQLWVLEIHIRHPELSYGAYFEDLLMGIA